MGNVSSDHNYFNLDQKQASAMSSTIGNVSSERTACQIGQMALAASDEKLHDLVLSFIHASSVQEISSLCDASSIPAQAKNEAISKFNKGCEQAATILVAAAQQKLRESTQEVSGKRMLKSEHNTFVRAYDREWKVDLVNGEPHDWEHWYVENWGCKVVFKAIHSPGRFLRPRADGKVDLVPTHPKECPALMWKPFKNSDGTWSFLSIHGRWLSGLRNGTVCSMWHCKSSETFTLPSWDVEERINKDVEEKVESRRHFIAALYTSNPQILLLGGGTKKTFNIFLLDYATKKWKILPIKMPCSIEGYGSVIVKDELYIIGGCNGKEFKKSVYRLNKEMEWEERADMNEARSYIGNSCVVYDNCIWVFGGSREENETDISLNTMEKYDPNTNRWEMKPEMKRKREDAAVAVIKDKIYVCGGHDGTTDLDSVEVFDTTSEVWTDFCTMPQPRSEHCLVVEGTSIILIGGMDNSAVLKKVWKIDVKEKKWTDLPPLNQSRSYSSAVKIEGGYILVTGGSTFKTDGSIDKVLNTVEIFDGEKWNEFPSLPVERYYHTTCCLTPSMIDSFNKFVN